MLTEGRRKSCSELSQRETRDLPNIYINALLINGEWGVEKTNAHRGTRTVSRPVAGVQKSPLVPTDAQL